MYRQNMMSASSKYDFSYFKRAYMLNYVVYVKKNMITCDKFTTLLNIYKESMCLAFLPLYGNFLKPMYDTS